MREALLYQQLKNNTVRCGVCQRRCLISDKQWGYCKTRVNKNGKLFTAIYGVVSSANVDPIEKKPVFHYKPGSACFSLGTYGCNFRCIFCQNWQIAHTNGATLKISDQDILSPKKAVEMAEKSNSFGIAVTYNEPAIWLEYSLDVFKIAKRNRILRSYDSVTKLNSNKYSDEGGKNSFFYTVWVTNGYATPEAIDLVAPYLDVYRVDLKSFDDRFYQRLINVPKAQPVFETTIYVRRNYPEIHIECITNIIPTWNDQQKNLAAIARWIKTNLGPETPWHVTRFFPAYAEATTGRPDAKLPDFPTPPETLFQAREIGMKEGLKFVYIGNLPVEKEDDTFCPKCGNLAIKRNDYLTEVLGVDKEGNCVDCGQFLNVVI